MTSTCSRRSRKRKRLDEDDETPPAMQDTAEQDGDEDDSSDTEHEEDDGKIQVAVYDSKTEPFPNHPAFDIKSLSSVNRAEQCNQSILAALKKEASKSKKLQFVVKHCEQTSGFAKPVPVNIAIMGEAGDGKSSTVNNTIDIPGIALTGCVGKSVTNVPAVYQGVFDNQKSKFAAKVFLRISKEFRELIDWLLNCYQRFKFNPENEVKTAEDWDVDMLGQSAVDTFVLLFCDLPGFGDYNEADKTLERDIQSDRQMLLDTLCKRCRHLLRKYQNGPQPHAYLEADTVAELHEHLDPFTTNKEGAVALWPLVKHVCIGTSESRLLQWVSLVDLPGTSDTNPLRARVADNFLSECQALCYVIDIKRAINNPSLRRAISMNAERFSNNFCVVVSKIDHEVNAALAEELRGYQGDMTQYDEAAAQMRNCQEDFDKLERRSHVPRLSVSATGIPALRERALLLAGPSNWACRRNFVRDFHATFRGCYMLVTGCQPEDQDDLLILTQGLRSAVSSLFVAISDKQNELIDRFLRLVCDFLPEARRKALGVVGKLDEWNGMSYLAFYYKNGNYRTQARGPVSWNELLLQALTDDCFDPAWYPILRELLQLLQVPMTRATEELDRVKATLLHSPTTVSLDRAAIARTLEAHKKSVRDDHRMIEKAFVEQMKDIKFKATKDRSDSFFTIAMQPAYDVGKSDGQKGVLKRQRANLRDHVNLSKDDEDEPFGVYFGLFSSRLKDANQKALDAMKTALENRFSLIAEHFEFMTEQKSETKSELAAREALKPVLEEASKEVESIVNVLENIEAAYPGL
ncbi:hypothetical protein Q7P37_010985 [Cladosporium fusiforme]